MQLTIHSQDFPVTEAIDKFVRKQVKRSMAACSEQINHLIVRLKIHKNSKSPAEPQCCVEVHVSQQPTVVVIKRNENTYASIKEAVDRAGRTTLRQIGKSRVARRLRH